MGSALPALLALLALTGAGRGAQGPDPPAALRALEALLASGSGALPRGAVAALVGTVGSRAQCGPAPCGACISAGDVLALAGATAGLEAPDLPWLGAAVLGTLWDPAAACSGTGTDTSISTGTSTDTGTRSPRGLWAARARALHRAFTAPSAGFSTRDRGTGASSGSGAGGAGPALLELSVLLEAIEHNYRSEESREGCLDAGAVLATGAAVSPRVGAGRVLAALGALVLRGRCLCPTGPPAAPPSSPQTHGTSNGTSDGRPEALPWATLSWAPPEVLLEKPQLGDTRTPPSPGPRHGDPTPDTPGNGTAATGPRDQLSPVQRYAVGSAAGLVLALVPLLALLLLRCPLAAGTWRWLRPLLLGGGAGALSGDGILHLLPQVLGLHDHGGAGAAVGQEPQEHGGAAEPHWKLMAVLGGIYGAFLLERLGGALLTPGEAKVEDTNLDQSTEELQSRSRWVLPVMTSLGAAAHSLADGLALGAAFAGSWQAGAAAGAGLILHELPHALGDAAVLAHAPSAAARRRALWLRVAAAAPALPGLWAGLALGGGGAGAWVQAAAAGAILYLAMADMVPALLAMQDPHPWVLLGVQSLGLALGWGALLLLALYEDRIIL